MLPAASDVIIQQGSDTWTKLGTLATLAAVLVALFGPLLLDRLRRPRLKVTVASSLVSALATATHDRGGRLTVNVTNQGRRQANDVQVFLTAESPMEVPGMAGAFRIEAFQSPVPFFHREGGRWSYQYSVPIPQGFARPLHLLVEDETGPRLTSAAEHDPATPLPDAVLMDGDYRIVLDIAGSNFKVIRLEGRLRIEGEPHSVASWITPPVEVRHRAEDPLPRRPTGR